MAMMQRMMIAVVLAATTATFGGTLCPPQQITKLTADDGVWRDYFGNSVALDAGVAVIGAQGDDDNGIWTGSAYVFEQQADGTWSQTAKLTADDGAEGDLFGSSVATSGGVAVIGAYRDDDNGSSSGSAYVYELARRTAHGNKPPNSRRMMGPVAIYFGYSVATSMVAWR